MGEIVTKRMIDVVEDFVRDDIGDYCQLAARWHFLFFMFLTFFVAACQLGMIFYRIITALLF